MQSGTSLTDFVRDEIQKTMKHFDPKKDEPSNYVQAFYKAQIDRVKDSWTFTDGQLTASVVNLFTGGTSTTAMTLRWALFYLCHYPEWQEKIYQEIRDTTSGSDNVSYGDRAKLPLTEATIMESQRCGNIGPFGTVHRTTTSCKLAGYDIPADTVVVPFLTAILQDPKVYSNPEKFDPTRFVNGDKKGDQFTHLIPFLIGKEVSVIAAF